MSFARRLLSMIQLGVAVWSALTPQLALAYDHPLSDGAVREAYFIGQNTDRANTFLSQYAQALPVPHGGAHVAEIELSTPYAQVVEISAQHTPDYSAQQAALDYRKRGDFIVVRVKILFTPTYTGGSDDFWRHVSVGLVQKKHMAATSVDGQPLYTADRDGDNPVLIGANVFVQFSVDGVESNYVQVEVVPPEGLWVHATFDLSNLR
ncbi:MAG: hypothetical protein WB869_22795 [Candidatus Acidiferrales bacterium]